MIEQLYEYFMKTVFLRERSIDVYHTVKSYSKEGTLPFVSLQTLTKQSGLQTSLHLSFCSPTTVFTG